MTYIQKYDYTKVENQERKIVNVKGDGNCFFRAIAVSLGYNESQYMTIKEILSDFVLENSDLFSYLPNIQLVAQRIKQDFFAAYYDYIYLTS